jgi:transposase
MARPNKPRTTNRYSAEFKLKAVKLTQIEGVQVKDVAEALGIHPFMLSRWRKEVRDGVIKARVGVAADARSKADVRALAQLKRKYALLAEEHELLKKAIRFTSDQRARSSRSSTPNGTGSA